MKYKNKIKKWRNAHPVNRNFRGRSRVAVKKPRIKGKFVTHEEYSTYLKGNKGGKHDLSDGGSYYESVSDFSQHSSMSVKEEQF